MKNIFKNKNETEVENKTKLKITTVMLIVICILALFFAFAYFTTIITGTGKRVTATSVPLSLTYTDGEVITASNMIPGNKITKTFSVKNTSSAPVTYDLYWKCIENDFTRTEDLTYTLTSTNSGGEKNATALPSTSLEDIVTSVTVPENTTQTYTLTITYARLTEVDQSVDEAKKFAAIVDIFTKGSTKIKECVFSDTLKIDNPPTTYTTIPGQQSATTDEGLIEGPNDDYANKTYYFRGAVQDNYVRFANKTWRVIRINGDGSVRLILDGVATTSSWNTNNNSTNQTTAMTYVTYNNSILDNATKTWYNNNIGNNSTYSNKVVQSKYCSDRTISSTLYSAWTAYTLASATRMWVNSPLSPSMSCSNSVYVYDRMAGNINADEVAFAGAYQENSNQSYYLYNSLITSSWWTMTPNAWGTSGNVRIFYINHEGGNMNRLGFPTDSIGVRPVISLSSDVTVRKASEENPGTSTNPYIIP